MASVDRPPQKLGHSESEEEEEEELPSASVKKKAKVGVDILEEFSHHDPSVARINNGSFGCCPSSVLSSQRRWQLRFLRQPDLFYSRFLRPSIDASRRLLLPLINASHLHQISLVDNATTATAIVLQHISRSCFHPNPGDAAIILHYAYGSVKKSVRAYISRAGGHVIEVPLPFPVHSNDEIIAEFRNSLSKARSENRRVRFAVIDHITSMPSVVTPVKELVRICREEGVDKVFVDAAHGIGCTRVDMEEIGADFYASNLHKWMFCPPSVALLYVRNAMDDIHHPVVSSEYGKGLPVESAWVGTRDYSSQLVVPQVLDFVNRFEGGIDGIIKRNHDKVVEKGNMLVEAWGTHLGCPPHMCASMIMVALPDSLRVACEADTFKLRSHLRDKFGVEVPIYYRPPNSKEDTKDQFLTTSTSTSTGYARISHQLYNKDADYDRFRDAVTQLVADGFTCSLLTD